MPPLPALPSSSQRGVPPASIAAAASAGLTEAEVGAFTRSEPVLPEAILLQVGVETQGALGQVLALPRGDGRRSVGATRDTGERDPGSQKQPEPLGSDSHAELFITGDAPAARHP